MENKKIDYKKSYKELYFPKAQPTEIFVPSIRFFVIEGKGDPNKEGFGGAVEALYSLSYTLKMIPKSGFIPQGYYDYTVFPLEGVWDITEEEKARCDETLFRVDNKEELTYRIMMRQPDFLTPDLAQEIINRAKGKKPDLRLNTALFEISEEGDCVQMMHVGSYDTEAESFKKMLSYCEAKNLMRKERTHREIYLSDPRRTAPEKLKTLLRWRVQQKVIQTSTSKM